MRVEYLWDPDLSANMKLWRKETMDEMRTEGVDIWRWSRSERHGSVVVKFRAGREALCQARWACSPPSAAYYRMINANANQQLNRQIEPVQPGPTPEVGKVSWSGL
jgi:hypothetical protein